MSLNLRKPIYPYRPIGSLVALARTLHIAQADLLAIAQNANGLYRTVKPKPGSTRQTFDAYIPLKPIHAKIKTAILSRVTYPDYLTGSLKGKDYKTNAEIHEGQAVVICEDVKGFFNAVTGELVYDIWRNFFQFGPEVSKVLTQLTTKDGVLPQGAIPSSYLANLALWRDEPLLQAKLEAQGVKYSRYVDDIAMSSAAPLGRAQKTELIAAVYGMLRKNGLSARRDKHEIAPATQRMVATKLVINRKAALTPERRANARVAVFQAEAAAKATDDPAQALKILNRAANRVGQLGRFHPNLAASLKARLVGARNNVPVLPATPLITGGRPATSDINQVTPPWEPLAEGNNSPAPQP